MRPNIIYRRDNGKHYLDITPTFPFKGKLKSIEVSEAELEAIGRWERTRCTIQEALPNWPPGKRELLITGMDDDEFNEYLS